MPPTWMESPIIDLVTVPGCMTHFAAITAGRTCSKHLAGPAGLHTFPLPSLKQLQDPPSPVGPTRGPSLFFSPKAPKAPDPQFLVPLTAQPVWAAHLLQSSRRAIPPWASHSTMRAGIPLLVAMLCSLACAGKSAWSTQAGVRVCCKEESWGAG